MTMIKNAIVLKALLPEVALLRQQLEAADWAEIAETEFRRDAFIPAAAGELVADFPSGFALCLRCQEKIIPTGTIGEAVFKRASEIEEERGEPLDDEERDQLYGDVAVEICKKAFVKTKYVQAFYHPESEYLFVNTSSPGDVKRLMGALVKLTGKVQTVTIHISGIKNGVTARLRDAIEHQGDDEKRPFGKLAPDDHARVKRLLQPGEPTEVVTYKGTWLANNEELLSHLKDGFEVEEIGLSFPPAAMSFRLTHQFRFKGIDFEPQEPDDDGGEGDDVHDWRMMAMREVEGMVGVVNELCELMEYEQPVLEEESDDDANQEPTA
ncbi:recombination associated protein RdgC [Vreelandella subterranea]|uniref:Recombination-associated protein RdgC n=1 Tax=Vreelandella subterranea TaxID=416874 RepID=A0A1H9URP3_9GAMM|nr:recombination-associated protein RdgC [Halomonas subterranea]SES11717.1 recombination associated protein RdgC [Halomonas subterranea]